MHVTSRVIVVTGGAEGIGRALVERFHKEGAKAIVVADRNAAGAEAVAKSVGGLALACDVGNEADIQKVVSEAESRAGPIDLFCSNAGIGDFGGEPNDAASSPNEQWQRLAGQRDGARLRGEGLSPLDDFTRKGDLSKHDFRRRPSKPDWQCRLRGHETRGGRFCGNPRDYPSRSGHPRVDPLPTGG